MARIAGTAKKTRLSLELSNTARERLNVLRELSDSDSLTEVVRRSAAVYELLLDHQREGYEIVLRKDGEERVLALP